MEDHGVKGKKIARLVEVAAILREVQAVSAFPPPRVLVVGEVNPYGVDPKFALYPRPRHASGNRLRAIMGLTDTAYMKFLDRANLCAGKWSAPAARRAAEDLVLLPYDVLILLGAKVRGAFDGPAPFKQFVSMEYRLVGLPHPSGRCRTWSDPGAAERAREVLAKAAPWVPWGMVGMRDELVKTGAECARGKGVQ